MITRQISVEELCSKLKPVFGKKIDSIYLKYAMAESREEKDEIAQILSALYHKNLNKLLDNKVLLEPPRKEVMNGDYSLAYVSYSGKKLFPFNLRERDWPRHVCISGMSGSGKTTLAFNILQNFIEHDKSFLVFDWKKSFRPLLSASSEVMNFTVGDDKVSNLFKININQPPKGIDPKEWINVLCDLLTECFFVSYGVHKVLLETLDDAFKEWGIYDGSDNYPTWNHIKWYLEQKLDKTKGREAGWLESALRIASVMTFGNFGKVVSSKEKGSFSVEDLLDKKVILELNALSGIEKKFFCEFVLTYIYKLKKSRENKTSGRFNHAILVDEAHNIFLKSHTHFSKESVTDMIYREMREYGTSLICLDQHISKLSDTVKGNSACSIAFQQQLPQDIYDISSLMQLREKKEFFSMLPVGSAIVKLSERYSSPFLVEVSPSKLREKRVSDADVKERARFIIDGIKVERGEDKEFRDNLLGKTVEVDNYHDRVDVKKIKDNPENEDIPEERTVEKPVLNNIIQVKPFADPKLDEIRVLEKIVEDKERNLKKNNEVEINDKELEINKESKDYFNQETIDNNFVREDNDNSIEKLDSINREISIKNKVIKSLSPKQIILFDFVYKKFKQGRELKELEDLLNEYREEGGYTLSDVGIVVNRVLEIGFNKKHTAVNATTIKKQKVYKQEKPLVTYCLDNKLDKEQEMFLAFLRENIDRDYSTVNLYKSLGLSSRKGNKIKNILLDNGLIQIHEVKNDKGWKKIIKLTEDPIYA